MYNVCVILLEVLAILPVVWLTVIRSEFLEALIQFTNLIAGKALTLPNASLILSD